MEDFVSGIESWLQGEAEPLPLDLVLPRSSQESTAILRTVDGDGGTRPSVVYRQVSNGILEFDDC